jgi:hypothetical protein
VRRLLLILAGLATYLGVATFLGLAAAPAAAATTCVSAAGATYRHSFDGAAGTVTVTPTRQLCGGQSQTVTLVSYTAAGTPGTAAGQFVHDSATGWLTDRGLTLKVAVPGCYAQVVAFFGAGVQTELTSTAAPYGSAKLGAAGSRSTGPLTWYAGGGTACTATPTVAYTYACDGTFTATLANAAGANTSAVFLTGGRRLRLSPGRSTTVKVAKRGTLTVRDSSFTTHVAFWQSPATGCAATAPAQTPAVPPAQPTGPALTGPALTGPALTASASVAAAATPTTTAATTTDTAYDGPAAYPAFPEKTTGADVAARTGIGPGRTGIGPGSVLMIALGLLMIGAGAAAIAYLIRLNRSIA